MNSFKKAGIDAPKPDYEVIYFKKRKKKINCLLVSFIIFSTLSAICFIIFYLRKKKEKEEYLIKKSQLIKEKKNSTEENTIINKKFVRILYEDQIQLIIEKVPSPNITAVICMIVKDEKDYLLEFIDYYKRINFTKIIIYDNNLIGEQDEHIEKILEEYIKSGYVEIHNDIKGRMDYPNFKKEAYEKCYKDNIDKYDWFFNINSDEFLFIMNKTSIQRFLAEKRYKECKTIKINLKTFTDNEKLYFDKKETVQQRFKELIPLDIWEYDNPEMKEKNAFNSYVRTLIRGRLQNIVIGEYSPEGIEKQCKASGEIDLSDSKTSVPIDYSYAFVKNYYFKSTEEYVKRLKKNIKDKDFIKKEIVQRYFYMNTITLDKIKIIEEGFNISLSELMAAKLINI